MPGPGTVYLGQEVSFLKPVFIDDVVTAKVTITNITERGKATLQTIVVNQKDQIVIDGKATIILPKED